MEIIKIDLLRVVPGMIVAEAILSNDRQIILPRGAEITSHMINLLRKWKVPCICVKADTEIQLEHSHNGEHLEQNHLDKKFLSFVEKYRKLSRKVGSVFEYMRNNAYFPYDIFYELANSDLDELSREKDIVAYLYKLKPTLDYTYFHAMNVGIIAGVIGRWCGFEEKKVKSLILAGLVHDIGKSKIPRIILHKAGQLSIYEREILKIHPVYGYDMAKGVRGIAPEIQYAILQHHERENGCGYPRGLYNRQIHSFAKIVAIADAYEAMTSNSIYKNSITPFDALEVLTSKMFTQFDGEYCKKFICNAIQALVNSTVLLSDKTQAEVLYFNCFMSIKPVVKKLDGTLVDLSENADVSIVEVIRFASCF